MAKYFGTDGIRGVVNDNLNFMLAYNVGKSLAVFLKKHNKTKSVIIGNDTRVSADLITHAIACGLCDYGVNVCLIGIVPTGCVSYLANKLNVGAGVMVTASHNAPNMNGIKLINNLGYKFSVQNELEIEKYIDSKFAPVKKKGKIETDVSLVEKYINFLISEVGCNLNGVNVAVDAAFGSNYKIAEQVFKRLGANLVLINNDNCGEKINVNCGALNVKNLIYEVKQHKCDFGFAFDGDADRLIVVLKNGRVLTGDELLFVLGCHLFNKNKLNSRCVVGTIMTNSGVEESFKDLGITLIRTDVGDRNVIEEMQKNNYSLGGESSGHICIPSLNTTCDALLNALYLLKIVVTEKIDLSELLLRLKKVPSKIKNVCVSAEFRRCFDDNLVLRKQLCKLLKNHQNTRIVVRPSGTENVVRIFAEGDAVECEKVISEIEQLLV